MTDKIKTQQKKINLLNEVLRNTWIGNWTPSQIEKLNKFTNCVVEEGGKYDRGRKKFS